MRGLRWDDGTKWGDVNARWSDPSYVLEPGDPGYLNDAPVTGATSGKKKGNTMNETPGSLKPLLALAKDQRGGAAALQAVIGLHHHTDATLNAAILKLEGDPAAAPGSNANKGSQLVFKMCEDAARDARSALKVLSDTDVKKLLTAYRDVLKNVHGSTHNAGWGAAGFTQNLRVPENHGERQTLLAAMRSYLAANAGHEATLPQPSGPPLAVTAAAALALGATFQAAFTLVNTKETDQETCKNLRDADQRALFLEVSGTTAELGGLLAADDPRWEAFGLNIPAHPNPPEAVGSLTMSSAGTGREALSWTAGRRASYYRIFIKIDGVDADFRHLINDDDLDYTIKDLTPGTTISVYVVAANAGGEAAPSPTVTKVVGA
jgi:hypothetical protein